ncbi:MAG: hypothetical protein NVS3B8_14270 [Chitinophagaceae bacterium]
MLTSRKASYIFSGATTGSGSGTASGSKFNPGTTTVLYRFVNDTSQTCFFTVAVEDHIAPVPLANTLPVITGDCYVTVTDKPKAKDNCAGIITGFTNDPLAYRKQGEYIITWTYDDGHHNLTTQNKSW